MKKMKKIFALLMVGVLVLTLVACAAPTEPAASEPAAEEPVAEEPAAEEPAADPKDALIGFAMPTHSDESWLKHKSYMQGYLEEMGYTNFDEQWAEDVVADQVSQIENMITKGVNVLVVAAVDGNALTDVLAKAAEQGTKVVAYDRLIMNTPHVDAYVTGDNFRVGVEEAKYIIEKLGVEDGAGPFNIEIFAGSMDDNNSFFFYDGAMSLLQPYIDDGTFVVKSGQTAVEKVAIQQWDAAVAQSRMDNLLTAYYADGSLVDAVLSPYDGLSIGIISSLKNVGYGTEDQPLPIVTGQDAEVATVISIVNGEQAQTVWKDFRESAKGGAALVDALVQGTELPINDTETYHNGVKQIPSFLYPVKSVDITNYMELFDTGFYNKDDDMWKDIFD
jgi:putative multiple sugar transport system substrate-binding protein